MTQAIFSAASRSSFRHATRLRVRWSEVDMQNIVFNAHYLAWYDTAFSDYWRSLGLPYGDTMQRFGCDVYLKKATTEFHASAKLDDMVEVCLRCERIGSSSLLFTGAVFGGNQLLNSAEMLYVYADPVQQKAVPVPEPLRELYGALRRVPTWSAAGLATGKACANWRKRFGSRCLCWSRALRRKRSTTIWTQAPCTLWHATVSAWHWPRRACCQPSSWKSRAACCG